MTKSCNVLSDRILWYDGVSTIDPDDVYDFIPYLDQINVTHLTNDVERYNNFVTKDQQILVVNTELYDQFNINPEWNIPEKYNTLDIGSYIKYEHQKLKKEFKWSDEEYTERNNRIITELTIYIEKNMHALIRTLICVINTMIEKNIVWGTGRGSSVSSYILYVIQVHDVDSYQYNIDFSDFIK